MEDAGAGAPRRESLLDVVLGELERRGREEPVGRLLYAARTRGNADDGGKALAEFHRRALQRAGEADGTGGDAGGLLVAFPNVILHVVEGAPGMLTALLRVIAEDAQDEDGHLLRARVLAVRPPPRTLPSDRHASHAQPGEAGVPPPSEGGEAVRNHSDRAPPRSVPAFLLADSLPPPPLPPPVPLPERERVAVRAGRYVTG